MGEEQRGKRHGVGTHSRVDGWAYRGEWCSDWRQGRGVVSLYDAKRFDGEWWQDRPNGIGVLTTEAGARVSGRWDDGRFIGQMEVQYHTWLVLYCLLVCSYHTILVAATKVGANHKAASTCFVARRRRHRRSHVHMI